MRMLSFDLGDFNALSSWHLLDRDTGEVASGTVLTEVPSLSELLIDLTPDKVLCEACTMTYLLADTVAAVLPQATFVAANTNADAWRWSTTKRKTDKDDAEKLIRLDLLEELPAVEVPDQEIRVLRRLLTYRQKLIGKRTSCYNAIRHACKQHQVRMPRGDRAWTADGLAELGALCAGLEDVAAVPIDWQTTWLLELAQLLAQVRLLNGQLAQVEKTLKQWERDQERLTNLKTAPGIGRVVGLALIAFLGNPRRFRTGKQVAAYVGLVPRVYQSGSSCRHGRITKAGNRLLRVLLINAAWQAVGHDAWASDVFDRVCGSATATSRRKTAIIAVARRLLIRCWAMMRDGRPWQQHEPPALVA